MRKKGKALTCIILLLISQLIFLLRSFLIFFCKENALEDLSKSKRFPRILLHTIIEKLNPACSGIVLFWGKEEGSYTCKISSEMRKKSVGNLFYLYWIFFLISYDMVHQEWLYPSLLPQWILQQVANYLR